MVNCSAGKWVCSPAATPGPFLKHHHHRVNFRASVNSRMQRTLLHPGSSQSPEPRVRFYSKVMHTPRRQRNWVGKGAECRRAAQPSPAQPGTRGWHPRQGASHPPRQHSQGSLSSQREKGSAGLSRFSCHSPSSPTGRPGVSPASSPSPANTLGTGVPKLCFQGGLEARARHSPPRTAPPTSCTP